MLPTARTLNALVPAARRSLLVWASQVGIQLLGLVSGILIVRFLPTEQYAYYTIAVTCLGAMSAISDGGLTNGLLATGGKAWNDRGRLGAVMATGRQIRRRMTLGVCVVALPVMGLLLLHQGAGAQQSAAIVLSLVPVFLLNVVSGLREVVPRLHQQLAFIQVNQLASYAARTLLVVLALAVMPLAGIAVLIPAIPQLWVYRRLRGAASEKADPDAVPDPETARELRSMMARSLPDSIYFAFSGQLTVWLIAIFGQTAGIAAVGALGRIAMVYTAITSMFALLLLPRFARLPDTDPHSVQRRYWQAQAVVALACTIPMAAIGLAPSWMLKVLGPQYAGLEREVVLMAWSGMVATLSGAAFSLGAVRGILLKPWLAIPAGLAVQVLLILVLPLHSIEGVILLGLLNAAFQWLLNATCFSVRMHVRSKT